MPTTQLPNLPLARAALIDWCHQNNIRPRELAATIHCDYQHAWKLLCTDAPITLPTLARLLIFYGTGGPAPAIAAALKTELETLYAQEKTVLGL
jgi:hypothetical protein